MPVSYNGWSASPDLASIGVRPFTAAGVDFPGGVREGDVATVLRYVAEQFDARVERLDPALGCWGAAYRQNRNADNLSCHASGTAIDCNAVRHPNGIRGTFTLVQTAEIHRILTEIEHVVAWGGDFIATVDAMHFEIAGTPAQVATVARRLSAVGEEDMTPEQAAQLANVEAMLKKFTAERRTDHKDTDPKFISAADLLTKVDQLAAKVDALNARIGDK